MLTEATGPTVQPTSRLLRPVVHRREACMVLRCFLLCRYLTAVMGRRFGPWLALRSAPPFNNRRQ